MKQKQRSFAYPAMIWVQIKTLYASGVFESIKDLYKYLKQNMKGPIPCMRTITHKKTEEKWSKTCIKEKEEEIQAKTFADRFEKAGLGDQATVNTIVAGVKHAEKLMAKASVVLEEAYKGKNPETIAEAQEQARIAVTELRTQLQFLAERNKLTGAYAATKVRIPGIQGLADDLKDLHAMSNDELDREIEERYHKLMDRKKNARNRR